jgi:feruloyl esterase
MKIIKGVLFSLLSLAVYLLVGNLAKAATCESLAGLALPHATITVAQSITDGNFTPSPPNFVIPMTGLPPLCRVAVVSRPTIDSVINIEVWIPLNGWNGKFVQQGCGFTCGTIFYFNFPSALARGYAVAATDDGNPVPQGTSGFLGHPEKIIDFGYRAIKETTDKAKAVITAFNEGKGPKRSYFDGCSDGGREALMEAQRYPDDFDGIIAGSPAYNWTGLFEGWIWNEQALTQTAASNIPNSLLPVLTNAALAQCGKQDGNLATDNFLNDPRDCKFDPVSVQCKPGQDPSTCLSDAQVQAMRKIYSGPHDPRTGKLIFPGYEPPTEVLPATSAANGFFADFVFQNPNWDYKTFNFTIDVDLTDNGVGKVINALDPDIRRFKDNGGKMIGYVGWEDQSIAPMNTLIYYNQVKDVVSGHGDGAGSFKKLQEFYRVFTVPGMWHCGNGEGPNAFGNYFTVGDTPVIDAEHDILTALDQWVEKGVAPDKLIGTHYINNTPASGIQYQRPICPFPQLARYKGTGDTTKPDSFACVNDEPDSDPRDQNLAKGTD